MVILNLQHKKMKIMNKTIIREDKLVKELVIGIKKVFPNNDCYFIGSFCIDNVEKSDIDILVLFDNPIDVTTLRTRREQISLVDDRLQLMCCFKSDEKDLKTIPYISMQNTKDKKIVNRKDFTEKSYQDYKSELCTHLWKKRKFNKAIIKDKNRKTNRLLSLNKRLEIVNETL